MAETQEQGKKRTPFSAKLPQVSLDDALEPVRALGDLGAPATPHVIAQHLGTSYATNARFRTRLGAAGYYGLIEKQGDKRALTKRAEAVIGGDDGATKARQEAVMSTSFGPVIHSLRGRPVNESAVSLRLQGDYGVPEGSAPSVAQALVGAATQAELISKGSFDAAAIEAAASVMPTETPAPVTPGGNGKTTAGAPKSKSTPDRKERPKQQEEHAEVVVEKERPFVPGVQVIVKVDASTLSPQQIAELVRELRKP